MLWTVVSCVISVLGFIIPFCVSSRKYRLSYTEHIKGLYLPKNEGDINLSVSYKGEDCKLPFVIENLVFANYGNKDVVFNQKFDRPVEIKSSVVKFVDIKCSQSNEEINSTIKMEDDTISLSWGILKKGESISIDVFGYLIDADNKSQLEGHCFNVYSRAADIKKIDQKTHKMSTSQKLMLFMSAWAIFVLYFTTVINSGLREVSLVGDVSYKGEVIENATVLYNIFSNKYYITTTGKRVDRYLPAEDVSDIILSKCKLPSSNYRLINLFFVVIISIVYFVAFLYVYYRIRKYSTFTYRLHSV